MKITKRQLRRMIKEELGMRKGSHVSQDIIDRIKNVQDPLDREALEDSLDMVRAGEMESFELEQHIRDLTEGRSKALKNRLKNIIKESLLVEKKMQDIIVNSYEDVEDYNILANYALNNDIKGALADPTLRHYIEKNEMGWVADEAGGWFEKVGEWEEMPAPEGWDRDKAYKFLTDLENASWKEYDKMAQKAIADDPDKEFLEFLGNRWTSMIEPSDMEDIKWKEYKKYIRLKPPRSISHGVGEIHITKEDTENLYPGAWEDFKDFLATRAGGQLGRRKPYKKSPPPYYD